MESEARKALREAVRKEQKRLNELIYKKQRIEKDIQESRNKIAQLEETITGVE